MISRPRYIRPRGLKQSVPRIRTTTGVRQAGIILCLTVATLLAGCASEPGTKSKPAKIPLPSPKEVPTPVPAEPEQVIDDTALARARQIARTQGPLAAKAERNVMVVRGLDATTAALIDAEIAWYAGALEEAEAHLMSLPLSDQHAQEIATAIRQTWAEQTMRWLDAARYAHQRLNSTPDPQSRADLKDQLWSSLMHLSDTQLASAVLRADGPDWRGWLELNGAYRRDRQAVATWIAGHPNHGALDPLPGALDTWLDSPQPETIAVLLPLSGRLQGAGEAVLKGLIEALYLQYRDPDQRPAIITVDTTRFPDAIAAYRDGVRRGADLVLGPLTKSDARTLGSLRERPVPVLAVNRPEALPPSDAVGFSALSLAPEDEARQLARMAFARGQRRALIIRPDTDWGRRMEGALSQTWQSLGGRLVNTRALTSEPTASEQVSALVGSADSEARIKAMEDAFEAPVESRARRRQDFDAVFLLAANPAEARTLRPLLVYHYAGDVPVYSPSSVNSGQAQSQNRDLNDLVFVEIPAVMEAVEVDRYTRLSALGADALRMVGHWRQAEATTTPLLRAETGLLRRLPNGEIERELMSATFDGGLVKLLEIP